MKVMFFDEFKLGVLKGDAVVDVSRVVQDIPHLGPQDVVRGVIERWAEFRPKLEAAAAQERGVPLDRVKLRPPLPKPTNVVCMAVNYMEDGTRSEPAPINAFLKSPSAIIGDGDTMVLPDVPATGTNHRGLSGLQDGDVVEVKTEGLGTLRFNIRDALKRTWDRETRLDRQQKGQEGTTPQLSGKHAPTKKG